MARGSAIARCAISVQREDMRSLYVRQLHGHEDATHAEGDDDGDECDAQQQDAVEARRARVVGLVEQHEAEPTQTEEEARRQALHDVLAIDAVLHEGHLCRA